jgi:hypothetical protein
MRFLNKNSGKFVSIHKDLKNVSEMLSKSKEYVPVNDADEKWVTIKGTHVQINGNGDIVKGPSALKEKSNQPPKTAKERKQAISNTVNKVITKQKETKDLIKNVKKEVHEKHKNKVSAGELADKAWGISFKNFPSQEGAKAHREAAEAYRKKNMHDLADKHEDLANSHTKELIKKLK